MSLFRTPVRDDGTDPHPEVGIAFVANTPNEAARKRLEDWAHRLQGAAYEAGDNGLSVLESNLLDLRDDVVVELHSLIQS